jgi:Leucine-rich repeat (LRR) protein
LNVIGYQLGNLTGLQTLNLSSNELTQIPRQIRKLTNLQKLDLSYNAIKELPPEVGQKSSSFVLFRFVFFC